MLCYFSGKIGCVRGGGEMGVSASLLLAIIGETTLVNLLKQIIGIIFGVSFDGTV